MWMRYYGNHGSKMAGQYALSIKEHQLRHLSGTVWDFNALATLDLLWIAFFTSVLALFDDLNELFCREIHH